MANKKEFTKPNEIENMLFKTNKDTETKIEETKHTNVTNDLDDTSIAKIDNDTKQSKVDNVYNNTKYTNVSKHFDERGKRDKRLGLLLDEKLNDDLKLLVKVTDNKSVNDLIVTILIDYVENPNNQKKLNHYKQNYPTSN